MRTITSHSVGIGLRSEHITQLMAQPPHPAIDFLELAPDNWMNIGGLKKEQLADIAKKYPLIAHGLSLSIGDITPLNLDYIHHVRTFLDEYHIDIYSDHLCFSRDPQGYLYDLLPIPHYADCIPYLAQRIKHVQDLLGRQLILENISAYHRYHGEMPEYEFWGELLHLSGCAMLLDINNVYVNAVNHGSDPIEFIRNIPSESIRYYHIAGHLKTDDRLIDTHGMPVSPQVVDLAQTTLRLHGCKPLLLERDNNVPPLEILCKELHAIQQQLIEPVMV